MVTYFTACVWTSLLNWQVMGPAWELKKLDSASLYLLATKQTREMFVLAVVMGVSLVAHSDTHIHTHTHQYMYFIES